jgi:hypothetical protein
LWVKNQYPIKFLGFSFLKKKDFRKQNLQQMLEVLVVQLILSANNYQILTRFSGAKYSESVGFTLKAL